LWCFACWVGESFGCLVVGAAREGGGGAHNEVLCAASQMLPVFDAGY